MIRLRSPHTVNVYGAITSRKDCFLLVIELLPGGDLRALLKDAAEPLEEEHARRITREICAGMYFLHGKDTVHGDLKSPNVLFDGLGRAKVNTDAREIGVSFLLLAGGWLLYCRLHPHLGVMVIEASWYVT